MHDWSEKDFDWNGLNDAIKFIAENLLFWRINVIDYKEKFGTARIYCSLGLTCLHDIFYPGYAYYQFPNWLSRLDIKYGWYFARIFIYWWSKPFHDFIYRRAYKKAVKKWPHLKEEIICDADFYELLKGI